MCRIAPRKTTIIYIYTLGGLNTLKQQPIQGGRKKHQCVLSIYRERQQARVRAYRRQCCGLNSRTCYAPAQPNNTGATAPANDRFGRHEGGKCPFALPDRIVAASLSPGLFPCLNTPSGISKPGLRALRISRAGARDCVVLSTYISRWSWGSSSATANKTTTEQQPMRLVEPFAVANATRMSVSY